MSFKYVVFAAAMACVKAGGLLAPGAIAYSAAPAVSSIFYSSPVASYGAPLASPYSASVVAPAITSQSSNILRSFGNLGQISTYSKSIDTPFSSVRKADVRVSNPGVRVASVTSPLAYAAPALAAAPLGVAYSAAPAVSHVSYSAPIVSYGW